MVKHKHIRFDYAIKRLLRQKDNFSILEGFLSELLYEDIKIQEILESESNQIDAEDKYNVDSLNEAEKSAYENFVKTERIRESEIDTPLSDGYMRAEKKLNPLIEEAKKESQELLIKSVKGFHANGIDISQIAKILNIDIKEVKDILNFKTKNPDRCRDFSIFFIAY